MFFITFIRALSALLITNSHYTGVYPTDIIANGGLLGNVLFFAVSGYCLANIKLSFGKWYLKRIIRIYPVVWIITAVYAIMGFYKFSSFFGFVKLFVYPTYYHFIASILVLYIPFYFVMKLDFLKKRIPLVILGVFLIQTIVYIFFFDRSTYHIDDVFSHMIRFLFFIAMLIGAYIRQNDAKYRNNNKVVNLIMMITFFVLYFASKTFFVKYASNVLVCQFQLINQIMLLILLYFIFAFTAGIDSRLEKLPKWIKNIVDFISKRTLEIYLVQEAILLTLKIGPFPLNWFILTFSIAAAAIVLHFISEKTVWVVTKGIDVMKKKLLKSN